MSKTVIKIENLSKLYRLVVWGSSTLRDEFARSWAKLRDKEDPTLTIGQTNELSSLNNAEGQIMCGPKTNQPRRKTRRRTGYYS